MNINKLAKACAETMEQRSFTAAYHKTFKLYNCATELQKDQVYRMRNSIYCREHGYESPTAPESYIERDEYDDHAEHFLLRHRISNEMVGSLRVVLPNEQKPDESFPMQKICDHPLLQFDSRALNICEISRFCMAPRFRQRGADGKFLSSYHAQDKNGHRSGNITFVRRRISYPQAALLQGAFETALRTQIMDCIWMVEPDHLPSLRAIGFDYHVLGLRVDHHGGMQPLIFNIKHVLDGIKDAAPACWDVITDGGRLHDMADALYKNDWQDRLIDQECIDKIYEKLSV